MKALPELPRVPVVFSGNKSWLNFHNAFALEPALTLGVGPFHTSANQSLFGAIGDSAPDRWGRVLMRRLGAVASTTYYCIYLLGIIWLH